MAIIANQLHPIHLSTHTAYHISIQNIPSLRQQHSLHFTMTQPTQKRHYESAGERYRGLASSDAKERDEGEAEAA
jgi:hypothetical protein